MTTPATEPPTGLDRPFFESFTPRFRGEIWQNAAGVGMGRGYANNEKPFDIDSAAYLREPFRVYRQMPTCKMVLKAAVQTLKTFFMEETTAYEIQHDPADMRFYLCDAEDAHDHAKGRLMDRLKALPGIANILAEIGDRFDITTTEIYFPGMTFTVRPLNESSTQRVTLRYVKISDAWMARRNGMIRHALARTTQHPHDKKIIIESQGSEVGDDFDEQWESTNKNEPHVICPFCDQGQIFEFERYRDDKFVPVRPVREPDFGAAPAPGPWTPPKPGTYSGMQKGEAQLTLLPDGELNERAIREHTYYECYHCGSHWLDRPALRAQIDRSSFYVPTNPNALPENVGYTWPAWINQRLPWGGEEIMLGYLKAKRSEDQLGNRLPLQEWYQKRAAKQWNGDLGTRGHILQSIESYDPNSDWAKAWKRVIVADCQLELSHFAYSVHEIARDGESRQLARSYVLSLADIDAAQKLWKVPDQLVFLDAGHKLEELKVECAKRGHWGQLKGSRQKVWLGWNLMKGSGLHSFLHSRKRKDGSIERWRSPVSQPVIYHVSIDKQIIPVRLYNFSALHCGDMFQRYRDGKNAPKCQFLPETDSPSNDLSFTAQIHSMMRIKMPSKALGGIAEYRWVKKKQNAKNEYWDLGAMFMAFIVEIGIAQVRMDEPAAASAETNQATSGSTP